MDAVEFLKNHYRMCASSSECGKCEAYKCCTLGSLKSSNPEKLVKVVEEWAKEHPVKTRQSELLKIFPKATKMVMDNNEVVVAICPRTVDDTFDKSTCARVSCVTCQKEYWTQEMTEDGFVSITPAP